MVNKTGDIGKWEALRGTLNLTARRSAAFLADWIILFGVLAPMGYIIGQFIGAPQPQTGPEVWYALLLTFSGPAWLYFIVSDSSTGGATLGKRAFKLRVTGTTEERVSLGRAVVRTVIKLLPWELTHLFVFALSEDLGHLELIQWIGLAIVYALASVYLVVMVLTGGNRSVHDFVTDTRVDSAP